MFRANLAQPGNWKGREHELVEEANPHQVDILYTCHLNYRLGLQYCGVARWLETLHSGAGVGIGIPPVGKLYK